MKTKIVSLGIVGVDSGQLMICDPCYVEQMIQHDPDTLTSTHTIYRHKEDGSLWQYTYNGNTIKGVNPFPGRYDEVIPKYGKSPNELKTEGIFEKTDIDPTPNIKNGEFSYEGISKRTLSDAQGGQLNFDNGITGAAVAFSSGFGDGSYEVFAEIAETKDWGKRIKKIWVEFF